MDIDNRLVVITLARDREVGEMSEGGQKVQISSCKMESNIQYHDYS